MIMSELKIDKVIPNQMDAIDSYFECITACSLDDKGIECTTKCLEIHLKNEDYS